jgi:hypothetical protein
MANNKYRPELIQDFGSVEAVDNAVKAYKETY